MSKSGRQRFVGLYDARKAEQEPSDKVQSGTGTNAARIVAKTAIRSGDRKDLLSRLRLWRRTEQHRARVIDHSVPLPPTRSPESPKNADRNVFRVLSFVRVFLAGAVFALLFVFLPWNAYQWLVALPNPSLLSRRDITVTTKVFDRNGVLLYEIYADENRSPLKLSELPRHLVQATVAIEDKEFFHHNGISWRGIGRALWSIYTQNQIQGGSTITQQLIKSALLTPEIHLSRKVKEGVLAIWAEYLYSKDQILEMYLNQVPYGGTAWGVEAASQTYFGKSARDLTLPEAALLAGLPAAPSDYSPFGAHPEKAFERQVEVLRRMVEDGYISQTEADEAMATELTFIEQKTNIRAPHFVMYVKRMLEERFGPRLVERGGLQVYTSLDIGIQEMAESVVEDVLTDLVRLNVTNGAVMVTDPRNGDILAMVGSKDYWDDANDGNVNVILTAQQPGSTVKVVTYATALEMGFTAATLLNDSPVVYKVSATETYKPVNYDSKFHGLVPMRYALANSYNIPAVRVLDDIGIDKVVEKGVLMGIDSWNTDQSYGLSLTLGGADVTMLDMVRTFGTLAYAGKRVDLRPIMEVTDLTGVSVMKASVRNPVQAVKAEAAWIISNILSDNTARANSFGTQSELVIPDKHVSVKTGTSNDKRDNWAIGYTPSVVVASWVGNNDNEPMHPQLSSGLTGASTIWHGVMSSILSTREDESNPKPDTVVTVPCYFGREEYFISGTEPAGGRCMPIPTPSPSPEPTPQA